MFIFNPPIATRNGMLTTEQQQLLLSNPPTSRRGKAMSPEKMYLHSFYSEIINSRAIFIIQIMNPSAQEYKKFRLDFNKNNFKSTWIRNNLFKAALKSAAQSDQQKFDMKHLQSKMTHMFVGSTIIISTNRRDWGYDAVDTIALLSKFTSISTKHPKAMVIGAKLDGMVLTLDEMNKIKKMYPGGIKALQSELLGTLEASKRAVVDVLESTPKSLILNLESHVKGKGI